MPFRAERATSLITDTPFACPRISNEPRFPRRPIVSPWTENEDPFGNCSGVTAGRSSEDDGEGEGDSGYTDDGIGKGKGKVKSEK